MDKENVLKMGETKQNKQTQKQNKTKNFHLQGVTPTHPGLIRVWLSSFTLILIYISLLLPGNVLTCHISQCFEIQEIEISLKGRVPFR